MNALSASTVRSGLRHLLSLQDLDGRFDARDARRHALATLAVAEAYWLTRNPRYRAPALAGLRHCGTDSDGVRTALWRLLAVTAGRRGGLDVDPVAFERLRARIVDPDAARSDPDAVLLGRILLGEDPRSLGALVDACRQRLPRPGTSDLEFLEIATMAMFQASGAAWKDWNRAMRSAVVDTQNEDGSWDPPAGFDRIESTTRMALCLQVYYRYDRVFGLRRRQGAR